VERGRRRPGVDVDAVVDCAGRSTRQVNAEIRRLISTGAARIQVRSPAARHCLAVALFAPVTVRFDGSVGYLCCSLGDGAHFEVAGNAGWSIGADMHAGSVLVDGVAGTNTGASMRGGLVVVRGSVGTRAAISNKGGTVIVGGDAGYMSGFMQQTGTLIVCGDVDDGIGDSMYAGDIFVGGATGALGADCVERDLTSADAERLHQLLGPYALEPRSSWRKFGSGGRLHHFQKHEFAIWREAL
jgi:methylamine---glutamate N-methyltransferase subunit B